MEESKSQEEVLSEIYRNAQLALQSISDILPEVEDEDIKQEIMREHEEYEKICSRATMLAKDSGQELKEPGVFKKMMMWSSIKMNASANGSKGHIAEMMIQGTVMGITALKRSQSDSEGQLKEEIASLLSDMIALEESCEENLKQYL